MRWSALRILRRIGASAFAQHITTLSSLESFFATLKNEMYYRGSFATRADAKHAVIRFIEADYNRRRPHSTIGYQIPAKAMEAFFERTKPAAEELPVAA